MDKRTEIRGDRVPAGYPLEGSEVTILDDDGRPVKRGATGEIAVRSAYLAAGYWRDPKLTRAKFLSDPGRRRAHLFDRRSRILFGRRLPGSRGS